LCAAVEPKGRELLVGNFGERSTLVRGTGTTIGLATTRGGEGRRLQKAGAVDATTFPNALEDATVSSPLSTKACRA